MPLNQKGRKVFANSGGEGHIELKLAKSKKNGNESIKKKMEKRKKSQRATSKMRSPRI